MSNSNSTTPRAFTSQAASAEDLLRTQTVGLVNLDEYRKRRRDVEDIKSTSGTATPKTDLSEIDSGNGVKKKKRRAGGRKLLSFDDEDEERAVSASSKPTEVKQADPAEADNKGTTERVKLKANPTTNLPAPRALTKATLAAEATEREQLRAQFLKIQEQVRDSEVAIPFVFYDGSNVPGGTVKVKKGEHIWLFLEKCRKVGAELGVSSEGSVDGGGTKQRVEGKKSWARIGVDDLMMIRGDIIIPHHYEFYYFIANEVADPGQPNRKLFNYRGTDAVESDKEKSLLHVPKDRKVEGQDDEPTLTKIVDRRWYEKNKHIYPASLWREYRDGKEKSSSNDSKRDALARLRTASQIIATNMNAILRCNRREGEHVCRRELLQEAYVTTCSHVFCLECVQDLRFTDSARGRRQCLACETALPEVDDVVRTNLRPSADHLSTILCGLKPETVMDCATKAIKFWDYQMLAELAWQEHVVQRWVNKYNGLRSNASKVIEEANGEIANLQHQVNTLTREKEGAQRNANELADRLKERTTAAEKLQTLYSNLKMKVQTDQVRNTTSAVDRVPLEQHVVAAQSHQSFEDPQFDTASLPPLLTSKKHQQRQSVDEHGVELLHPFQRSGSARGPTTSELAHQSMMPPPMRTNGRDSHYRASVAATPAQRAILSRVDRNHTFPQAAARQSVSQHFPTQSAQQHTQSRIPSQSYRAATGQSLKTPARIVADRNLY